MLGNNPTQMDYYNKNIPKTQGTLMANWFEERVHRQQKGNGRALTQTHLPKKHDQLLTNAEVKVQRKQDDTKYRILGDTNYQIGTSQNYHYGKNVNKADLLAKNGPKQQLLQQMYLQEVSAQLKKSQQNAAEIVNKRNFETTNRTNFISHPINQNRIGRVIMRDQNGAQVNIHSIDEELKESNGFKQRGQITSDQQLKKLIDTDLGYQRQQPITFWKQKIEDKCFYMSKQSTNQPFSKNNQFLKTYQSYKHNYD